MACLESNRENVDTRARWRIAIGLLGAAGLIISSVAATAPTATAATIKRPWSYYRSFKDWEVACDNVKRCIAVGALDTDTNLVVWLTREAGPDGGMSLRMATARPAAAAQMRIDGRPFDATPAKWKALPNQPDSAYPSRFATDDVAVVSAWVEAARNATTLSFGDPAGADTPKTSLAGLSAALLAIDAAQGRVGTVTAWVRKGTASATSVPAAQPLPVAPRAAAASPALPAAEARRLIAATRTQFRADIKKCASDDDSDPDAKAQRSRDNSAEALSDKEALVALACDESGAYNHTSLWYRVQRAAPYKAVPVDFGANASAGIGSSDSPAPAKNELSDAAFDSRSGQLESLTRVRSLGDCGDITRWIFDSSAFVLKEERTEGSCIGLDNDEWPWLYRTKPR
ncbi:DUF1176 domain-containing protein [Paraburkholderia sp. J12]|uniref:DUF1176 domain-containing protein n=1 Tax=Paraburkholderia sp. J12 TaxID=2805432 RepID=UPI002ABE36B5|nr:DUF1176 domain-containing protein [Paraburkholderia sp. J12]